MLEAIFICPIFAGNIENTREICCYRTLIRRRNCLKIIWERPLTVECKKIRRCCISTKIRRVNVAYYDQFDFKVVPLIS